ncbi:hypothetical protein [Costertonia aggregata]|uniref:TonB C-terminal domain-containing protein n=1 Tax=Costertonia aggregata TaxID=343403 RepID=A0A7H9AR84_9FLAO|nr:hypothetical protein [Costertonia aggregata]QLG45917.1 hypothetical protein HYG79_11340 [Costertonia aggregata]
MKPLIFTVLIFLITLLGCKPTECEIAELKAKSDFANSDFKLHSMEILPVENTYFYVLREHYNVKWRFIDSDSIGFFYCYDSIMTSLLNKKLGINLKTRVQTIADSLENQNNWNSNPTFEGGLSEIHKLIRKKLTISKEEIDFPVGQKILLEFEISESGEVINPIVRKGVNEKIDKKLVEIINELPNWTPGYQFGKPIRKKYSMPLIIEFEQ